ncbi:AAR2 protein-domain-containing protein [Syncephalis pseudoplumigaleata]|uniref:AAR2 protein-domain-containing protein n=2 Tax=Zoopagomycota TaxID=1913638 RepID=A0A4P9ZN98_9FUNG|nr:AAR2 protein-domain-containing protein [Syncephalis pseudoplumigaleata]RKP34598.1 AAR2 protein-domain-containing protein [Dimargaris cristalligena]|eukprot:RKP25847.1 AAR2 protein-domain-containing protein [Syncephalis pseudoplumigaleata]
MSEIIHSHTPFAPQVMVRVWDPVNEQLFPESHLDNDQRRRYADDIRSFDPRLGAYPLDPPHSYQTWLKLSGYVSPALLTRVLPRDRVISGSDGGPYDEGAIRDASGIPFTMIDLKRSFPPESQGEERTRYSLDKSWLLSHLLNTAWSNDYRQPLGELQLGFICLLMGQNYAGFEQWKALIHLLCLSSEAIAKYSSDLYPNFIDALQHQLNECPEDFFTDVIMVDNFVFQLLKYWVVSSPDL